MIRKKAALTSQKATGGMIKWFSSKHPPAEYSIGSQVIVRRFSSKSRKAAGRKRAGKASRITTGTVLERNLDNNMYKVGYLLADREVEEWFGISDLTAVTLEEENKKRSCNSTNEHTEAATSLPNSIINDDDGDQIVCSSTEIEPSTSTSRGYYHINTFYYHYCCNFALQRKER